MMTHADRLFGAPESDAASSFTRRDAIRALFRHKWTVVICFLAVTLTVIGGLLMLPPTYETEGKLLVRTDAQQDPSFFSDLAAMNPRLDRDPVNRRLETEMELIETRPFAEAVVRDLGLTYDQVYHKPLTHLVEPLMVAYDWMRPRLFGHPAKERKGFDQVVEAVQRSIVVQPVQSKSADVNSNLLEVHFRAAEPVVAQRGLQVLLDTYARRQTAMNDSAAEAALSVVSAEAGAAATRLSMARARLRDYLAGSPGALQAASPAVAGVGGSATPAGVRGGSRLNELDDRLTTLQLELLRTRQVYREESDTVASLRAQIAALQAAVEGETRNGAGDLAQLAALEREVRLSEARATQLEDRRNAIALFRLANTTQPSSHVVVEPPLVPDSSDWKKRVAIGVLGALMGVLLGLALAGMAEIGDPTFTSKTLVRRWLGLEVLTVIPASTTAQVLALVAPAADGGASASASGPRSALRTLAARLVSAFPDAAAGNRRGRSVLVTSARPGEGKSLVANALAVQMSSLGYGRILLVDAVPRGADPAPQLQLAAGVKTTFAGGQWSASEEEIDSVSSLSVMTAADSQNGARPLNDRTLYPLLEQASSRFDWIIFDGGCLDDGDVSRLSHVVDAMLLVIDAPRTRRQVVRDSLGTLPVMPGRLTGVVLNNVRREIPDFLYNRV